MAKILCDCCGKDAGSSGGISVKDGLICEKCLEEYKGAGKVFRKNLKVETIRKVVQNADVSENASEEKKPLWIWFIELPLEVCGMMDSPQKALKWSIIAFVLGVLLTFVALNEPIKYLKDGAEAQFFLDDVDRKWINTGKYDVTEHYVAEKDGQTIRVLRMYTEYTDQFDNVIRREGDEDSPFYDGAYVKVYREDGRWLAAKDLNIYSMILLLFVPVMLYIYTFLLAKHYFKTRKTVHE